MARVYYLSVVNGKLKFSEVIPKFKEEVRELLIENGYEELIQE